MDTRVDTQRYAFIARRETEYLDVEQNFKRVNQFLNEKIAGVRQYEKDMYSITDNYESHLFSDIFTIVKKSLTIDKAALKEKDGGEQAAAANLLGAGSIQLEVKPFSSRGQSGNQHD